MKTLSYGDEIENAEVGTSNLELLISDDKLSANSVNRILQNLYEDNEYNYTLIQNLIKNLYGREDGILPNILEEFKEVRILESGTGQSYFRVPFGAINVMQPHYKDIGMSHGLSYSGEEENGEHELSSDVSDTINNFYSLLGIKKDETTGKLIDTGNGSWRCFNNIKFDEYYNYRTSSWEAKEAVIAKVINDTSDLIYKDYINIDTNNNICGKARYFTEKKIVNTDFIDDGFDTYTFFNKPKLSIAKRQIANYINLDIADLDNNIKIFAKKFDNAEQLGNSYVHRIAKSNSARAEIETFGANGGKDTDGNDFAENTLDKLSFPFVGYYASITENTVGAVDSSVYTANTENVNFPNLKKDTTWIIAFRVKIINTNDQTKNNTPLFFSFYEGENDVSRYLPTISTFVDASDGSTIEDQINTIVSDINASYKDYYYAEKINVDIKIGEDNAVSIPAISITSRINYTDLTDNVRLLININTIGNASFTDVEGIDGYYYSSNAGNNYLTKTDPAKAQDYYYDSISLLTGIFSKYSAYVVNENLSKSEFALEETINIPIPTDIEKYYYKEYLDPVGDVKKETAAEYDKYKYYIYLNSDFDEKFDVFENTDIGRSDKHVSTSKMFGCAFTDDLSKRFEDLDEYKYIIKQDLRSKPIALFSVVVRFDSIYGKTYPEIEPNTQVTLKPVLDPNKIYTRFAELNKLSVNTNTEIKNQFYYTDEGVKNYSVTLTSNIKGKNNELIPIEWKANPEEHSGQLNNTNLEGVFGKGSSLRETRAIKACVSSGRDKFSSIADNGGDSDDPYAYYKNVIKLGIDDVIETFAPYVLSHSRDGRTQEVLASGYGKRIKLHKDRKLRIEQQQTHNNFNDLNLLEITKDGFLFKRNDNSTSLVKNYINLTNNSDAATSEMKARDVGILLSAKEYIGNADNDENNYFKLYANNNKTWIKGVTGKLTIAANHSVSEESDIVLENKLIKYFNFSAKYGTPDSDGTVEEETSTDNRGNVSIESTNASVEKGAKYLRLKGNFVIGNEANGNGEENSFVNKTPYVAIFNTDTFLKGKLNVTALNDTVVKKDCSSFTIEKDKIFASNYNDIWVNGNYKAEKDSSFGRYSLRLRNNEGIEFAKIKARSATNADINKASTLTLNDDFAEVTFKYVNIEDSTANNAPRHSLKIYRNNAELLMSEKTASDRFAAKLTIDEVTNPADNDVRTRNTISFKTSEDAKISLRTVRTNSTEKSYKNTKLFANVGTAVFDADNVYVGGKNFYDDVDDAGLKAIIGGTEGTRTGNFFVRNKTVLGLNTRDLTVDPTKPTDQMDLQVYGRVVLGHPLLKPGTVVDPNVQYYSEQGWPYTKGATGTFDLIDDFRLFVGGRSVFQNDLNVEGNVSVGGKLSVQADTKVNGNLEVTKNSYFESNLNVKGETTLNTDVSKVTAVKGSVFLQKDLTVTGETKIGADVAWKHPIDGTAQQPVAKDLYARGDTTFNTDTSKTTTVVGDVDIKGKLTASKDVFVGKESNKKTLTIDGDTSFNTNGTSDTKVTDKVQIGGLLKVVGKVNVEKNLVIGSTSTSSPTENFIEINGNGTNGAYVKVQGTGTSKTEITGGDISCVSVTTSSSRAKKKNIAHSERDAVKAINDIEIVDFFYKNDRDEKNQKVGFIAEDTDSIFSTNNKDCMDHSNCIGMLLKAIQELSAEIEELKKNA